MYSKRFTIDGPSAGIAPIPPIAHYWKGYLAPSPCSCSRSARPRRSRAGGLLPGGRIPGRPRGHRARRGEARRPGESRRGRLRGGADQPHHALRRPRADGRRRHARRRRARAAAPSLAGGRSPAALRGDLDKPRESSGGGGCGASRDRLRDRARRLRLTLTETTMATLKVQGPGWRSRQSAILNRARARARTRNPLRSDGNEACLRDVAGSCRTIVLHTYRPWRPNGPRSEPVGE